ncbi:MAG TPA: hypothetical protein VM492_12845 [Sumerlaeia bacterium]|nr:hypothetical protein [Sumerlaeia bacterium]
MGYGSGENVQVLRLLCWAMEPEPSIRKEVLTQWLCEKETIPDAGEVMREMENVTHAHTPADAATRRGEIETALAGLDKEKIVRQERRNRRMQSPNVVLKGSTGCRGLDRVAAQHLSEKFLGSNLFYADAPGREKIYESLPWPDIWLEGGNRVCRTFYALLYSFEPDPILRRRILLPRIEVTAGRFEAGEDEDFWLKILDPVLACLDDGEKEMRRVEMMAMKPPILTPRAKEERRRAFEMHEERIRRIRERYESQKATDPTSPTSPTVP